MKKTKIVPLLLLLFTFTSLLFPVMILNKIFFGIIALIMLLNIKDYKFETESPIIIFGIFLFGFINSFFNDVDLAMSQQFFLSAFILFYIYPIIAYKINFDKIAKISGFLLALYTGISYLILEGTITGPFSSGFELFFADTNIGSWGYKAYITDQDYYIRFGGTPFLYLSFILYVLSFLEKKSWISFIAILSIGTAIVFSGQRGVIISSLVALLYVIFKRFNYAGKLYFLVITIPILLLVINFFLTETTVFSSQDESNNIKARHIESFFENLNFANSMIGNGLGANFYSKGSSKVVSITEITPMDMVRYFGFIFALFLYYFMLVPTFKINKYKGKELYIVLFLIYVINSMSNPTMFNSFGLLLILWYWDKILSNQKEKKSL